MIPWGSIITVDSSTKEVTYKKPGQQRARLVPTKLAEEIIEKVYPY